MFYKPEPDQHDTKKKWIDSRPIKHIANGCKHKNKEIKDSTQKQRTKGAKPTKGLKKTMDNIVVML